MIDRERLKTALLDAARDGRTVSAATLLRMQRIQKTQGTMRALRRALRRIDAEQAERGEPALSGRVEDGPGTAADKSRP